MADDDYEDAQVDTPQQAVQQGGALPPQGQPPELLNRLAALDQHFPPNVRTDRPYDQRDILWQGPFFGKGGPQLIRNPITGGPTPMAPGTSPDMYLNAINTLAQAKARAQANVMRGWNTEQAASEAMARAAGVDPAQIRGMNQQQAQGVVQAQVGARKEGELQQIRGEREADRKQSLADREELHRKQGEEDQQNQAVMSSLPQTMDALSRLDPQEALAQAPLMLAPLAKADGHLYQSTLQHFAVRAQQAQAIQDRQQAAIGMEAERRNKAEEATRAKQSAKDETYWTKNIEEPLDEVASGGVKMVKVPQTQDEKDQGKLARTTPDYQGSVAEYLSKIRTILSLVKRKQPDSIDDSETSRANIFAEARSRGAKSLWLSPRGIQKDEALKDDNPSEALDSLRILAQVIQDHVAHGR
jgi:hypothetical protein